MVAHAKDQGSSRESNEEERLLRLFVVVGKDVNEDELKADFEAFGTVQYVNIVKDRATKESKGFAYIKFYRLVHAAKAFESCDKSYKAVFAEPRPVRPTEENHQNNQHQNNHHHYHGNHNLHNQGVTNGYQQLSSRSTGSSQVRLQWFNGISIFSICSVCERVLPIDGTWKPCSQRRPAMATFWPHTWTWLLRGPYPLAFDETKNKIELIV